MQPDGFPQDAPAGESPILDTEGQADQMAPGESARLDWGSGVTPTASEIFIAMLAETPAMDAAMTDAAMADAAMTDSPAHEHTLDTPAPQPDAHHLEAATQEHALDQARQHLARHLAAIRRALPSALPSLPSLRRHPRTTAAIAVALLALVVLLPLLSDMGNRTLSSFTLLRAFTPTSARVLPTPTATPFGTPDPHQMDWVNTLHSAAVQAYIDSLVSHMTTDEELGQMLMIEFVDAEMTPTIAYELKHFHIGSVVLYKWNVSSADGLRTLDQQLQANTDGIPLLVATDQEGGYVNRLSVIDGYLPSAEEMGARNDPNYVYQRGQQDGRQLYDLGINMDMAPVVDVQSIPDDETVMGTRMFGWTPDKVTTMAGAYLNGLQSGGRVVGTLKHFPGLGDVPGDPHQESVYLNRSVAQMQAIDWAPYKALIATGQVGMIMTTHITVPALDPNLPTTLSYPITTGILRDKLGFQGVIITDGIYMRALGAHYSFQQIIVGSVLAGNDIVCSTYSLASTTEAFQDLQAAVANGTITRARLDESVKRILLLKLQYGLLKMPKS